METEPGGESAAATDARFERVVLFAEALLVFFPEAPFTFLPEVLFAFLFFPETFFAFLLVLVGLFFDPGFETGAYDQSKSIEDTR